MASTKTTIIRAGLVPRLEIQSDEVLFAEADSVRRQFCGDEIQLRGIIEFSNHCACDCLYCGLRVSNKELPRYRMAEDEIVDAAKNGAALGIKTVVLQSGEDPHYTAEMMCNVIRRIKAECDVAVTLSIGERPAAEYRAMREAGADRYLLKHETSNRRIFAQLHPGDDYDAHINCLKELKMMGYQIGSGCMVGLPEQTIEDLVDDILLCKDLDVEMVGIGPFIPHGATPLAAIMPGDAHLALRMIALARIVLKNVHIPATTSLETISPGGRKQALQCGANVIMPNITPAKYRKSYEIYPNKAGASDTPEQSVARARAVAAELGRPIGTGYGHSLKQA